MSSEIHPSIFPQNLSVYLLEFYPVSPKNILLLEAANNLHFSSHSEWSPFASLRAGSAESRNLFQAKSDFSIHFVRSK